MLLYRNIIDIVYHTYFSNHGTNSNTWTPNNRNHLSFFLYVVYSNRQHRISLNTKKAFTSALNRTNIYNLPVLASDFGIIKVSASKFLRAYKQKLYETPQQDQCQSDCLINQNDNQTESKFFRLLPIPCKL